MKIFCIFVSFVAALTVAAQEQLILNSPDTPNTKVFPGKNQKFKLLSNIRNAQAESTTEYFPRKLYPPLNWHRQEGIYDSFVHLNFHGGPQMTTLRNAYRFPDDNAFVTMFIAKSLVELSRLDPSLNITDFEVLRSIRAIGTHRDKNSQPGVPLYDFWNQVPAGNGSYKASPPNIEIPLTEAKDGLGAIRKFLDKLPIDLGKLKSTIDIALDLANSFKNVFAIPPDSDDTGCNLALGMQLLAENATFPLASEEWASQNTVDQGIFDLFYKYTYRPLADDYDASSIDPRTYYWLRSFLQAEKLAGTTPVLITTWMQSISQVQYQSDYQKMPFSVNNVDASVTANAIYGLTTYLTRQDSIALKPEHEEMFLSNIRLLAFILENQIVEKYRTLALLYYPPKYAFYWFTARILHLLNSKDLTQSPSAELLKKAKAILLPSARWKITSEITNSMKCSFAACYWDDFLGNADEFRNHTVNLHEDRVFSTATALNALIDVWTVETIKDGAVKLVYSENTPASIKLVIERADYWLKFYSWMYLKQNAFFSSSIKTGSDSPFYFPHNSFKWINGTQLGQCSKFKNIDQLGPKNLPFVVAAVRGIIPENEFEEMIDTHQCFGKSFPKWVVDKSLNCDECVFPYWSSPALTETMQLLALVKIQHLGKISG